MVRTVRIWCGTIDADATSATDDVATAVVHKRAGVINEGILTIYTMATTTAAHLLSSAGAAMMELDDSGDTFAEMWRLWSEWQWTAPRPSATEFLEVLDDVARCARLGDDSGFQPRIGEHLLTCASDVLTYVLEHELIDLSDL